MEPLFSIVIPTFARRQMLARAVRSVQQQTIEDFEVLIVNDAGPAVGPLELDSRFRLLEREHNGGQGASFNTGLEAARGKFVAFLDDDDEFTPERLEIALKGHERARLAVCRSQTVIKGQLGPISTNRWEGDVSRSIREGSTPQMGRVSLPREGAPRFDESFPASADVEWWIRAARLGPVCTVDELGLLYHVHDGPRSLNGATARYRAQLRILELHEDYFRANRRARAYQLYRIGCLARQTGHRREAARHLFCSLLAGPSLRAASQLFRCLLAGLLQAPSR